MQTNFSGLRIFFLIFLAQLFPSGMTTVVHAQEWIYTLRPGDNLWNFVEEYLTETTQWRRVQDLQAFNHIEDPRQLLPGSKIRVPIAWLKTQPEAARVLHLQGHAELQRAGHTDVEALTSGHELHIGDRVRTGPESNLTLAFADGSEMLIQSDSEIIMDTLSSYHKTGMVDTRVRLQRGRVDTRVKPATGPGSRYQIITPAAIAAVRGTNFRVSVEKDQPVSRNEVLQGEIRVIGAVGSQGVNAGYGLVAEQGKPPPPPRELLPAPAAGPMTRSQERLPLAFAWRAVDGAQAYRFQISEQPGFTALLADQVTANPSAAWDRLPDGDYHLRVRAIDELQLEGNNGDYPFSVNTQPAPPYLLEPGDESALQGRPVLSWSEAENAQTYRLQLGADPDFSVLLQDEANLKQTRLEADRSFDAGRYYWRVASIDASGELGPFSDVRRFEVRIIPPPETGTASVGKDELVIDWQPVSEAARYHFQLAQDADFMEILEEKRTPETRIVLARPMGETYYYRVRAIDSTGQEGKFGSTEELVVPSMSFWPLLIPAVILLF